MTDGSTVASNRNGYGKTPVITVDGKSSVYLNGDSTINGDLPLAYSGMIRLKNSAMIEIGADATINMQVDIYDHYARSESQMIFVESGAELVNKGDIDTEISVLPLFLVKIQREVTVAILRFLSTTMAC